MPFTQDTAEVLGLRVLGWLATEETVLSAFQNASGATSDDIRQGASDTDFLGAVLDFVMMDDAWVVQCCDTLGVPYDSLMQARQALPGGAEVNWT